MLFVLLHHHLSGFNLAATNTTTTTTTTESQLQNASACVLITNQTLLPHCPSIIL